MEPGDHLGIWARNVPDWLTFMFATAKIGVVLVTVNPVYKSHELAYVIKQSRHEGARHHRRVPRRRLRRRSSASWFPRRSTQERGHLDSAEFPTLKSAHLHGSGEAPRHLQRARAAGSRRACPRTPAWTQPRPASPTPTPSTCSTPRARPAFPRASCSRTATSSTTASTSASARSSPPRTASASRCRSSTASAACWGCWPRSPTARTMVMVEIFDPVIVLAAIEKERATALYGVPTMFIAELDASDVRPVRPHVAAHRHHGRLALPDRDDAAGDRRACMRARSRSPTA